ncbi:non-ribosomal peptide synthetase [Vibrio gazogenes]|uniref:Non-ribosomal peptide synthase domain TIGR01720/amino acid adenylation domain-containing protein n=1 Tax=Vibrio gazogenes DSM 21264 = NBRC 103151 TaxID=1123492 RepID=A0A1M5H0R8_VIBGA|nr:non-ribosomal peptide synthetase [Vibrio gazogenes]USP14943.1 amino acid adenylation domain-containing protein [Vibrio gazogenes]SHG09611.1 non-ribosomal peptide synthase domain TIGR01720/amino acid adenylation domain-containing protein [Vibrio gazogenes DSM 21264] [Vibrio gazogenes DSM 21264 = NBRC 103151]SJN53511.1 Linear gramicidin synthase subunit D [Vibrio gazogenes]
MKDHQVPEEQYALIGTQQGIWFGQQVMPRPESFNVAHYIEIDGEIDLERFTQAVNLGVAAADSLHFEYLDVDGDIKQRGFAPQHAQDVLEVMDFSQSAFVAASALAWMKADLETPIELQGTSPRYRHCLIDVSEPGKPKWLWYQRYHHIDVDGFSFNAITQYIVSEYNRLMLGTAKPAPFTPFKAVIAEHQQFYQSEACQHARSFWQNQISQLPDIISLATGGRRSSATGVEKFTIELAGGDWLHRGGHRVLPSEFAMALVFAYLHLVSGAPNVCVGFPFMRRMGSSAASSTGAVVNVLPLTLVVEPTMTITDVARAMNKAIRQARRHQMYDAEQIQRDSGRVGQALYGPMLNYKPFEEEINLAGTKGHTHILSAGPIDDIEFSPQFRHDQLHLTLTAHAGKYSQQSLALHGQRFAHMVGQIARNPDRPLRALDIVPTCEQTDIARWSTGSVATDRLQARHVLAEFARQVERKPDAVALHFAQQRWTFAQLDQAIATRAQQINAFGAGKGDIIGVALPRSAETMITMLAVLRAGAVYLPIDLAYPQERIETILAQAQPKGVIVEQTASLPWQSLTHCISLTALASLNVTESEHPELEIAPSDVAYIVFTSGSTGKPKGVMNTHGALLNLLHSHRQSVFANAIHRLAEQQQCDESDVQVRAAHTTSFSFDASWEQVIWMLCGHTLYLYDDEQRKDACELTEKVAQDQINALDLPPSLLSQMLDNGLMAASHVPTLVLTGSEAVPEPLWSSVKAYPDLLVENCYGPTEFTVDAVSASLNVDDTPVIGQPILNTKAYVLDTQLNTVAVGVVGELYLAGAGLAKGYLNQPGMTAERFVANPFGHGQIMYRTGDLVKWRDNGQLAFIGRSDDQVKVRGFRIELGDVESAINAIDGVETTVVIAQRHGASHRLIAYCTLVNHARSQLDEHSLLTQIAATVPEYMVPAALVIMAQFPLNVNGKIDRQALPEPTIVSGHTWVAPVNHQQQVLCDAVAELLGVDKVGITDDFFALGGDSISAMGLGTLLRKAGYELRPREIFSARQLGGMAELMQPLRRQVTQNQDGDISPLPMWRWFEEHFAAQTRYVQGVFVEIESDVTLAHLQAGLKQLVANHAACRLIKQETRYVIQSMAQLKVDTWVETLEITDLDHADLDGVFAHASQMLSPDSQMLRLVQMRDRTGRCGLMLLAHHLIIDGVSWRILLPQLNTLVRAQVNGVKAGMTPEVTGLNTWSQALYQHLPQMSQQAPDWIAQESRLIEPCKPPTEKGNVVHRRVLLPTVLTQSMLSHCQDSQAIDVDELLMAAVTSALGQCYQKDAIKLYLESHGREEFDASLNLSQTLGWFTTEFPLVIDLPAAGEIPALLRQVKQAKRRVKDRGLGYMSLRYLDNPYRETLTALSQQHSASLLFNYLGRFEQTQAMWTPVSRAGQFADTFAVSLESDYALLHPLELNIFVDESDDGAQFALNWAWDNAQFSHDEIDTVCDWITQQLEAMLCWMKAQPEPQVALRVAAEYTQTGVSLDDVAAFADRFGPLRDILPALPLQEGLLFQSQVGDENSNYNSTTRLTFQGEVNPHQVQQALNAVITRHPQLGAKFDSSILGQTVQLIPQTDASWSLTCIDIRSESAQQQQAYLAHTEKQTLVRQFDLNHPDESLLGATLIHHGDGQSTLFVSAHHLVVDGWSTPILLGDFLTAYAQGHPSLPPVAASYAEVVSQLKQRDKTQAEMQWQQVLQDVTPTIAFEDVPVDDQVKEHALIIDAETTRQLTQRLSAYGLTMNSLMQGIWSSILGSMTGREDVVFGTPISGRFGHVKGIDEHIGLFSNTIPVRMKLDAQQSLLAQLQAHQATQIQLLEHDELGLGEIQQLAGGDTLFDTLLVVENYPDHATWYDQDYQGATLTQIHNRGYTHYPLTILVLPGEQIHVLFEYRDTVGIAQQVMQRFEKLLQAVIDTPEIPLTQLDLRLAAEITLQKRVNQTQVEVGHHTLRSLMAEQAARTPEQIALIDSDNRLSYQAMREHVIAIANLLVRQHVGVGDVVAVALPRSVRLSLAFNSIIECGAAYLPLDVSYPDDRLAYMVHDAQPKLIVTTSEYQARFRDLGQLLILDTLPDPTPLSDVPDQPVLDPAQAAYIIYTSGSTGNPKGVLVSHRAIVNRLQWMQSEYQLNHHDVVLQKTPCSFDVSVWEFFWPLIQGATLVMAPPESHKDPEWLMAVIEDYQVTTMHFVPSMLAAFIASVEANAQKMGTTQGNTIHESNTIYESNTTQVSKVAPSLQRVFCSGEALSKDLAHVYAKWIDAPLHNLYGPTEAAVDVTYCPAFGDPIHESLGHSVPIGLPVWNTQLYVLDSFLRQTPVGVPGELYLAGDQLAIGYLNRSALTADRFMANPFAHGERMYRTGDVVRWLPSGKIEYLGRSDDQLKIRGQRIELGEIEAALQSLPGVKQALVCAKAFGSERNIAGADERQLVGYVIGNAGQQPDGETLKVALSAHLPAHMVPIAIMVLEAFPLSANGKLDRKALPLPSDIVTGEGRRARPGLEAQLVAIFADVLGIDTLSAEDDFFALGGHSLMAMKLAADVRRVLNVPVSVGQIMVHPTVEKLALLLLDDEARNDPTLAGFGEVLPIRAGNGPALFCINSASGFAWQYTGLLKYLQGNYPIVGLQSPRPSGAIAAGSDMQDACDIHMRALKKIQPHGPYHLLGYSFGGTVAQRLAVQLQQQGETVAFLGLLDTYPPEGQDWDGPMNEEAQEEIEREKDLFLAANDVTDDELDQQRAAMFQDISANYEDAVRLLSGAHSSPYDGRVDLFVAQKTLPQGYDIDHHWQPFLTQLEKHHFNCSHEDILAPEHVGDIGEHLNTLLYQIETLQS